MGIRILVTGATGLSGAEVVRQALHDSEVEAIVTLSRKPLELAGKKLFKILHHDFLNYAGLENTFKESSVCIWCLGISQTQVKPDQYVVITLDYAIAAAKAMLAANPKMRFIFLSGMGADPSGKSRALFARVKGQTETALTKLAFKSFFIARPGGIRPIHPKPNTAWYEKLVIPFYPLLEFLLPAFFISSVDLAKAMLHVAKHGAKTTVLGNLDLKRLSKKDV